MAVKELPIWHVEMSPGYSQDDLVEYLKERGISITPLDRHQSAFQMGSREEDIDSIYLCPMLSAVLPDPSQISHYDMLIKTEATDLQALQAHIEIVVSEFMLNGEIELEVAKTFHGFTVECTDRGAAFLSNFDAVETIKRKRQICERY